MADKNNYLGFNFGDFSDSTNRTTGVPTKYLNLKGLTDFWAQIKSYIDAQDQNLFSSITSNSNKTLTIQGNGTSLGTYNGLETKTINITPASIGAAPASHTHTRSQITDFPVVMEGKNNPSYDLNTNFTTSNIPYICRLGSLNSNSNLPTGCEYGNLVHFTGTGSDTAFDLLGDYRNTKLLFRSGNWKLDGTGTINTATWKQIAFTSDIPTSLKNPYSLTIQGNGTTIDSYDGSAAKTINITPESIGALSKGTDATKVVLGDGSLKPISDFVTGTINETTISYADGILSMNFSDANVISYDNGTLNLTL